MNVEATIEFLRAEGARFDARQQQIQMVSANPRIAAEELAQALGVHRHTLRPG